MVVLQSLPETFILYHEATYSIAFYALVILALGFPGYHLLGTAMLRKVNDESGKKDRAAYAGHILRRLTGFILMGFLPFAVFHYIFQLPVQEYGINLRNWGPSTMWILIFAAPIILLNYYVAGKPSNLLNYPQIRLLRWSYGALFTNFISWTTYLLGYEMLFRGFLLFSLYYAFGAPLAIALNVILYSLAHIPKGPREMLGSLPFGVILCWITLSTGSFFAAFVIHSLMALSNEFFAILFHPDMKIKR